MRDYFGWLPDLPDARDYTRETEKVKSLLKIQKPKNRIDLRECCTPVRDQGNMGSCTANAAAGLLEYHRKRALGKETEASRMFIYKCTRDLMQAKGDTGAYIRTTMGALALFGACPEKYWDYDAKSMDVAPPAFCYSYAMNYQAISYFRLDERSIGIPAKSKEEILEGIKEALSQGLPAMFGFYVYESIKDADDGKIPYPERGEKAIGGHAVLCVGYDDELKIGKCTGAFLIRNSWGEGWGEKGYGWLPYDYLRAGLAQDWWSLVKAEWMDAAVFEV